jgi:hypothetical protein
MSKAVYRGVSYDTQKRLQYQHQMQLQHSEVYRGVKFVKEDK